MYDVGVGGTIQFIAQDDLTFTEEPFGRRMTIYYTALAWDSEQIELFTDSVNASTWSGDSDLHGSAGFTATLAHADIGPVFGVLQGFNFMFASGVHQSLEHIWLAVGRFGGGPCSWDVSNPLPWPFGPAHGVPTITYTAPGLERMIPAPAPPGLESDNTMYVRWDICSTLEGGDRNDYTREILGTVLWGRSLVVPQIPSGGGLVTDQNPRPTPDTFYFAGGFPLADADMIILGMEMFYLDPDGPVQQLETEIRGFSYDGALVSFALGGGMTDGGTIVIQPSFAALRRKNWFEKWGSLLAQDLFFDTVVGLPAELMDNNVGALRNIGGDIVLLSAMDVVTANDRFHYRFLWQNNLHDVNGLLPLFPLQLNPGDVLWIGGRYLTDAVAGDPTANPPIPPDQGTLTFRTNSACSRKQSFGLGRCPRGPPGRARLLRL